MGRKRSPDSLLNYFPEEDMVKTLELYKQTKADKYFDILKPKLVAVINGMINKEFSYNEYIKSNRDVVTSECLFAIIQSYNRFDTNKGRLFAYTNRDDYSGIETWDTRNVTDMSYMFYCANASSPTIAGIANWNTSKVVNMSNMFAYSDFDYDISKWDVSNVSNMSSMFYACPFSYDVSNWNIKSLAIAKQKFDKKFSHSNVKEQIFRVLHSQKF